MGSAGHKKVLDQREVGGRVSPMLAHYLARKSCFVVRNGVVAKTNVDSPSPGTHLDIEAFMARAG